MLFALRVPAQCACLLHDGLTVNVAALHFVQINKSPLIPSPLRSEYVVEQCAVVVEFVIIIMTDPQIIHLCWFCGQPTGQVDPQLHQVPVMLTVDTLCFEGAMEVVIVSFSLSFCSDQCAIGFTFDFKVCPFPLNSNPFG